MVDGVVMSMTEHCTFSTQIHSIVLFKLKLNTSLVLVYELEHVGYCVWSVFTPRSGLSLWLQ